MNIQLIKDLAIIHNMALSFHNDAELDLLVKEEQSLALARVNRFIEEAPTMDVYDKTKEIAIIWGVDDVQGLRPDLTEEQALEVLVKTKVKHDTEWGITLEVIGNWADQLFPKEVENATV